MACTASATLRHPPSSAGLTSTLSLFASRPRPRPSHMPWHSYTPPPPPSFPFSTSSNHFPLLWTTRTSSSRSFNPAVSTQQQHRNLSTSLPLAAPPAAALNSHPSAISSEDIPIVRTTAKEGVKTAEGLEVPSKPAPRKPLRTVGLKGKKAAITLTPTALTRLRHLLSSPTNPQLIRISVKNRGCAGMAYNLEYVSPDAAGRFDEVVEQDGVKVLVDGKALFSVIGSEMDWVEDRLSAKFVFNNPNVKDSCGCGESFTI